jgi:hypothetical protein
MWLKGFTLCNLCNSACLCNKIYSQNTSGGKKENDFNHLYKYSIEFIITVMISHRKQIPLFIELLESFASHLRFPHTVANSETLTLM